MVAKTVNANASSDDHRRPSTRGNVSRHILEDCILEVEKNGGLPSFKELWRATSDEYNRRIETLRKDESELAKYGLRIPIKIRPSTVYQRIRDWELQTKTIPAKRGPQPKGTTPRWVAEDAVRALELLVRETGIPKTHRAYKECVELRKYLSST